MSSVSVCRRTRRLRGSTPLLLSMAVLLPRTLFAQQGPPRPVLLRDLVQEAEQHNPAISASRHASEAATHAPAQLTSLPGPELTLQQLNVGSPRPFAGLSNSDFAYVGFGVSQEIPYPGKRAMRAEVARHDATAALARSDTVARDVIERLELAYVQLAYVQQALPVLERSDRVLNDVQQVAESRYRVGQGRQQDVLKAQLQHTKILQAIAEERQQANVLQAQLKQLLNRSQDAADIATEALSTTPVTMNAAEVLQRARDQNPDIAARSAQLDRERSAVAAARKEFKPDFVAQYMYQHTGGAFPDYYMGTLTVRLPSRDRQRAALAEADENQQRAADEMQAEVQRVLADAKEQFAALQGSNERLTIYRDGLLPQTDATFRAAMAAYSSNQQDFEALLSSFLDVLNTNLAYWRELADHESALARLERLTGSVRP